MNTLTDEQRATIERLNGGTFDESDWHHPFDLPEGWVAGWARGVYYGVAPDGSAAS